MSWTFLIPLYFPNPEFNSQDKGLCKRYPNTIVVRESDAFRSPNLYHHIEDLWEYGTGGVEDEQKDI